MKNRTGIREKRYCIIDLSDIQKPYAEQTEGLGRVRDGDKSSRGEPVIGNGMYWINGVMVDRSEILPVSSVRFKLRYLQITCCYIVCTDENWYRSTSNGCLMRDLTPTGGYIFCPVCESILKTLLNNYS